MCGGALGQDVLSRQGSYHMRHASVVGQSLLRLVARSRGRQPRQRANVRDGESRWVGHEEIVSTPPSHQSRGRHAIPVRQPHTHENTFRWLVAISRLHPLRQRYPRTLILKLSFSSPLFPSISSRPLYGLRYSPRQSQLGRVPILARLLYTKNPLSGASHFFISVSSLVSDSSYMFAFTN